jgi:hypothetical protein
MKPSCVQLVSRDFILTSLVSAQKHSVNLKALSHLSDESGENKMDSLYMWPSFISQSWQNLGMSDSETRHGLHFAVITLLQ